MAKKRFKSNLLGSLPSDLAEIVALWLELPELALGVAGVIRPFDVVGRLAGVDYLVMVIISFAFAGAAVIGRRIIGRAAGALLLCGYIVYIVYLLAYSR